MTRHLLISLILSAALAPSAHAWEKQTEENGVTIYRQATPSSRVDTFRGVVVLAHTTDQVIKVLGDVDGFKHFMPDLAHAKRLQQTKRTDGTTVTYVYQRLDLSAIDDRDFTVRAETSSMRSKRGNYWVTDFRATSKKGPAPKAGVVRVRKLKGQWLLEPMSRGRTRLTYTRHIELGGNVPNWLVNDGMEESLMTTLTLLRARCGRVL